MTGVTVRPVTHDRLDEVAALFGNSKTTAGCFCMWFVVSAKQCQAGWGGGNRSAFAQLSRASPEPVGLLAYRDGDPVGWCAAGPRQRYQRALRSTVLKGRDVGEDTSTWLVPCFFVRRDARKAGVTRRLLEAAVDLAGEFGAVAVEGFPLAGDQRHPAASAYVGIEPLFTSCGFRPVARPTAGRVVMRRELEQ